MTKDLWYRMWQWFAAVQISPARIDETFSYSESFGPCCCQNTAEWMSVPKQSCVGLLGSTSVSFLIHWHLLSFLILLSLYLAVFISSRFFISLNCLPLSPSDTQCLFTLPLLLLSSPSVSYCGDSHGVLKRDMLLRLSLAVFIQVFLEGADRVHFKGNLTRTQE